MLQSVTGAFTKAIDMRISESKHTLRGSGSVIELRLFPGVYSYARRRVQDWTCYGQEIEVEQGFRFGWWRFGVTRSFYVSYHHSTGEATTRRKRYGL